MLSCRRRYICSTLLVRMNMCCDGINSTENLAKNKKCLVFLPRWVVEVLPAFPSLVDPIKNPIQLNKLFLVTKICWSHLTQLKLTPINDSKNDTTKLSPNRESQSKKLFNLDTAGNNLIPMWFGEIIESWFKRFVSWLDRVFNMNPVSINQLELILIWFQNKLKLILNQLMSGIIYS